MSTKSIYFPDNAKTKEVLKRVKILEESYKVSFSELVLAGLTMLVSVKKPAPAKEKGFRTPVLAGIRG